MNKYYLIFFGIINAICMVVALMCIINGALTQIKVSKMPDFGDNLHQEFDGLSEEERNEKIRLMSDAFSKLVKSTKATPKVIIVPSILFLFNSVFGLVFLFVLLRRSKTT